MALLCARGYRVVALVRSATRLPLEHIRSDRLEVIEGDLTNSSKLSLPADLTHAYYLVHSMGQRGQFGSLEETCARNFNQALKKTGARQVIYLSGLFSGLQLSAHLHSRRRVEEILKGGAIPLTILRSGPVIGSGSAIFEMMRDLVERCPLIPLPRAARHLCQPLAICDVLHYLAGVLDRPDCLRQCLDIAGPDVVTYQQLVKGFADMRGLRRAIYCWPLPQWISSIGLYLLTSVRFSLAKALLQSMSAETKADLSKTVQLFPHYKCLTYSQALQRALSCVRQNVVFSTWRDSLSWSQLSPDLGSYIQMPEQGCVSKQVRLPFSISRQQLIDRIWSVGGKNGWYAANWAWRLRGLLDRLVGGVGLRRGRTHPTDLHVGDCLDFWRVLVADKTACRLLLYAEMKAPGQAWLEFRLMPAGATSQEGELLVLTATFQPKGIFGRMYWYGLLPIHIYIFYKMARAFVRGKEASGRLKKVS